MGQKLSTSSAAPSVVVQVRGTKGQFFVGKLLAHKTVDSQFKDEKTGEKRKLDIYEFDAENTDMRLERKEGKEYVEVPASEEVSEVSVFAPTRLNNALSKVPVGGRVKFVYLGLGKATKHGGKPHEYDVELLAEGE